MDKPSLISFSPMLIALAIPLGRYLFGLWIKKLENNKKTKI